MGNHDKPASRFQRPSLAALAIHWMMAVSAVAVGQVISGWSEHSIFIVVDAALFIPFGMLAFWLATGGSE